MLLGVLFLIALFYLSREGIREVRKHAGAARAKARTQATARGGRADHDAVRRRAARQATLGYWAGEVRHGFPHLRAGFARGWDDHRHIMAQLEHERVKRRHDQAAEQLNLRRSIEAYLAHWQTLLAQQQTAQQPAPAPAGPLMAPPPAQPSAQPPPTPGEDMDSHPPGCICPYHRIYAPPPHPQAKPAPAGAGTTANNGGTTVGEINYDAVIATAQQLITAADHAVNDKDLEAATTLADGLGGLLPDDSATLGLAADLVSAVQKVQDGNKEMQDAAAALKTRVEGTYGPVQDAVDGSGVRAPQPEFTDH